MKSEKLAEKINTDIAKWAKDKDKLVVAIDGYTGIGKTTILDHLEKINPDILAVHQDDFGLSRKKVKALLKNTYDRSVVFELRNRDLKKIARLVKLFRSGRNKSYSIKTYNYKTGKIDSVKKFDLSKHIFVIEGIFMFHPKLLNRLWNKERKENGEKITFLKHTRIHILDKLLLL